MNDMRSFVISKIVSNYEKGLDETDCDLICYYRNVPILPGLKEDEETRFLSIEDINLFLSSLYDAELLVVLESQSCQKYR